MKAKAWAIMYRAKDEAMEVRPIVTCSKCIHRKDSPFEGFWYCEAWDKHVNGEVHKPEEYFCVEGEME